MSYIYHTYTSFGVQVTTATTNVLVGPIDVKGYEKFCVEIQNAHSAIGLIGVRLQGAFERGVIDGLSEAVLWKDITSATAPNFPVTQLSASDTVRTTAILTLTPWIRVIGGASATSTSRIRVHVGGVVTK